LGLVLPQIIRQHFILLSPNIGRVRMRDSEWLSRSFALPDTQTRYALDELEIDASNHDRVPS
jgi:hypothetical protein